MKSLRIGPAQSSDLARRVASDGLLAFRGFGFEELSHESGATLFITLLALFKTLLCRLSAQEDIVLGVPVANRNRQEFEEVIGLFINTLVMRTDLSGDPSFKEVLRRVKLTALEAQEHQELPFDRLIEELHPERNLS